MCVLGQHVFNEDVSFSEGLTTVRTHIGGCVAAMQHLVASQLRLLGEVVPTVCALMLLIQPVFVIQVTSQVLVTKFPLAEAHPTVMAPKRLLVCVGLFMQSERAPFIRVVLQVPVQMFLLAEDLLAELALE